MTDPEHLFIEKVYGEAKSRCSSEQLRQTVSFWTESVETAPKRLGVGSIDTTELSELEINLIEWGLGSSTNSPQFGAPQFWGTQNIFWTGQPLKCGSKSSRILLIHISNNERQAPLVLHAAGLRNLCSRNPHPSRPSNLEAMHTKTHSILQPQVCTSVRISISGRKKGELPERVCGLFIPWRLGYARWLMLILYEPNYYEFLTFEKTFENKSCAFPLKNLLGCLCEIHCLCESWREIASSAAIATLTTPCLIAHQPSRSLVAWASTKRSVCCAAVVCFQLVWAPFIYSPYWVSLIEICTVHRLTESFSSKGTFVLFCWLVCIRYFEYACMMCFPLQVSKKEQMFAKSPTNSQYSPLKDGNTLSNVFLKVVHTFIQLVSYEVLYQRLPWY